MSGQQLWGSGMGAGVVGGRAWGAPSRNDHLHFPDDVGIDDRCQLFSQHLLRLAGFSEQLMDHFKVPLKWIFMEFSVEFCLSNLASHGKYRLS